MNCPNFSLLIASELSFTASQHLYRCCQLAYAITASLHCFVSSSSSPFIVPFTSIASVCPALTLLSSLLDVAPLRSLPAWPASSHLHHGLILYHPRPFLLRFPLSLRESSLSSLLIKDSSPLPPSGIHLRLQTHTDLPPYKLAAPVRQSQQIPLFFIFLIHTTLVALCDPPYAQTI